jgi:hypothetical protein
MSSGICLPAACSVKDVEEIAIYILSELNLKITSVRCKSDDVLGFHTRFIAVLIFSLLLLTVISSTIYELYMNHRKSELNDNDNELCCLIKSIQTRQVRRFSRFLSIKMERGFLK